MPVQYAGLKLEHQAVRSQVGMFDISHMGKFALEGDNLITTLQTLVPSDLARLSRGSAQYMVLLNDRAGIIDDLIFYYQGVTEMGRQQGILIANAATTAKDKAWLSSHLEPNGIVLTDISQQALIALQGPRAAEVLQSLVTEDLSEMKAFSHRKLVLVDSTAFVARTGYTGKMALKLCWNQKRVKNYGCVCLKLG